MVIRTEALTKDFTTGFAARRPSRALDALTIDVRPGEIFGLLGPNGAGKTTTLKLLLQLLFPTSGTAEILGRPAGDVDARRRLGYLPEHPYFYEYLTAEELLDYFGRLFGIEPAARRRRASALLDDVGIGAERRLPLRKLSKGLLQRVGLAQAMLNEPELLILDEPMSGLDPIGRRDVRNLIARLHGEGRTILFSSHILTDAEALCSRVAILAKGRLAAAGPLRELLSEQVRGWEILVRGLDDAGRAALSARGLPAALLPGGLSQILLPASSRPEPVIADLAASGASLVSASPQVETLEDVFLRRIAAAGETAPGDLA
ncbi:MAG TPA: ABC transporter ATP-binding protein [Vicinamibacterales bacterium]|nr:ABC transporter ATP-binding protein [Vicinamibacterales bacterium]